MPKRVQDSARSSGQKLCFNWGMQKHNPLCYAEKYLPPFCGVSPTGKEEHTGKGWGYLTIWEMELLLVIPLEPFLVSSEILPVNFRWNYFWEKLGFWQNSFLVSKKDFVKIALTYSRCSSSIPGPWRCLFWQALPLCRQWLCCISALLSVCSYPFIVSCGVCFRVIQTWHYVVIAT